MSKLIERLLIVTASLVIAIGVIVVLSGGPLAGQDAPGITGTAGGPGTAYPDQGAAQLRPGDLEPVYNSNPPTSGPHIPVPVTRNGARLTNYQLLQALQVGDVVFMYGTPRPPAGLARLAASIAPFSPSLAATGGAVVLATRPGTSGVIALAWTRMLRAPDASAPALRSFAQYWLGRGYVHSR